MNIKLMNKIAKVGTDVFGGAYTVSDTCENPERSWCVRQSFMICR